MLEKLFFRATQPSTAGQALAIGALTMPLMLVAALAAARAGFGGKQGFMVRLKPGSSAPAAAAASPAASGEAADNPAHFCVVTGECPTLWNIPPGGIGYSVKQNCPTVKRACEALTLQTAQIGIKAASEVEAVYADAKRRNPVIGTQGAWALYKDEMFHVVKYLRAQDRMVEWGTGSTTMV